MYKKIDIKKTLELQKEGAIVIDVRNLSEYKIKHINGAINVPLDKIVNILDIVKDKNKTLIVYCQTGKRSYKACNSLLSLGYNNVYDLGNFN